MPNEPPDPGMPQDTIDKIAATAPSLLQLTVKTTHTIFPNGDWILSTTSAFSVSSTTYNLLAAAHGENDGSWTSGGVRYWLHPNTTTMTAVHVEA